jgi:hypothetical protein
MRWTEIITLRYFIDAFDRLDKDLISFLKEKCENRELINVRIYRHESIKTDLSIHFQWESARANSMGSDEAHHMIQFLKEYGLVNHSVWVEERGLKGICRS